MTGQPLDSHKPPSAFKAVLGNKMMYKRGKMYPYEESSFHVDGKQKSFGVIAELWDKQGKE